MAPKKEQVFGGIGGVICIAAIVLAIVFGILWGQQKDKKEKCEEKLTCINLCSLPLADANCTSPPDNTDGQCAKTYNACYNAC
jgi:hypothetical protein